MDYLFKTPRQREAEQLDKEERERRLEDDPSHFEPTDLEKKEIEKEAAEEKLRVWRVGGEDTGSLEGAQGVAIFISGTNDTVGWFIDE